MVAHSLLWNSRADFIENFLAKQPRCTHTHNHAQTHIFTVGVSFSVSCTWRLCTIASAHTMHDKARERERASRCCYIHRACSHLTCIISLTRTLTHTHPFAKSHTHIDFHISQFFPMCTDAAPMHTKPCCIFFLSFFRIRVYPLHIIWLLFVVLNAEICQIAKSERAIW